VIGDGTQASTVIENEDLKDFKQLIANGE